MGSLPDSRATVEKSAHLAYRDSLLLCGEMGEVIHARAIGEGRGKPAAYTDQIQDSSFEAFSTPECTIRHAKDFSAVIMPLKLLQASRSNGSVFS